MNRTTIASVISLLISTNALFSSSVYAADAVNSNTVALNTELQTDEIVVTASRTEQPHKNVIADVTIIDREEIERAGQSTLTEVLQSQAGIEISANGGAGKSSGIYIRGTNSDHVIVLIDGLRVNSATLGTTAFENLPLAEIDKVEILRGPASSLYGQDAIGGVIQIFTKKGNGTPQFHAALGYGTYNTATAEAGVHGSVNNTHFALNVSASDTDGFSALKSNQANIKDNDGYRNLAISTSLVHEYAVGHELGFQLLSSQGRTQYDNGFNATNFSNYADLSQITYAITSKNQFTQNWLSTLRLGEGIDENIDFSEISFFNPVSRSQFKTKQRQYSWQNDITLPLGTLTLLADRLEERVKSTTDYDKTKRNNDGLVASYVLNYGAHALQASYRTDHSSQYGTHNTGGIGYGFSFTPNLRASASYGTAFKAPSFNNLYFPFFGNPDLKPEKARNLEAALRYEDESSTASMTAYENKVNDLISFGQVAPGVFAPSNINKAKIQGLTLAASQRWEAWKLGGSVDIQSPRDEATGNLLSRRANRHASANLSYQWHDWRFGSEFVASSLRYNDPANQFKLAGYGLLNFTADYKINQDWKIQGRVNNVLDKNYTLSTSASAFGVNDPDYNTPGTNLFVSLRWQPSAK